MSKIFRAAMITRGLSRLLSGEKRRRPRFYRPVVELLEDRTLPSGSIFGSVWNDLIGNGIRQASDPAVAGQVVFLDLNHDGKLGTAATTVTAPSTAITAAGAGILGGFGFFGSGIQVQDLPSTFLDVAVSMDLTNNSPDPITLGLISPLGFTVPNLPVLFTILPGQTFNGTIDGNSTTPITLAPNLSQAGATITGTYAPQQSFAAPGNYINNSGADGNWALIFVPGSPSDISGLQLSSWSLTFTAPEPTATTDAAGNYSFTGLAPGTYQATLADSAAAVVTSLPGGALNQTITVAAGQTVKGVDFGIQPAADLTSASFALTAPASGWGQDVTIKYTLTNQGAGSAGAFDVGLYLSANGVITTSGPLLDTLHFNGLAGGASTSGEVTVTLPANAPAGFDSVSGTYVGFVVDPTDSVRDSNRSDKSNQGAGIDLALLGTQSNAPIAASQSVQQDPSIAVDPTNPNHLVAAYMDYALVNTGYAGIGVAVSENGGKSWTTSSIPLPADFNQGAAAPTVAFDAQGNVYVSFMAATFLGTLPTLTNLDTSQRTDGFTSNNGIFVAKSSKQDGGLNWSAPVPVVSNTYSGTPVNFVSWPSMAIDTYATLPDGQPNPSYGKLYVTWTQYYAPGQYPGDPSSTAGSAVMIAASNSGGTAWTTQMQNVPGTGPGTGLVSALLDPQFGSNDTGIQVRFSTVTTGPGQGVYISNYAGAFFTVYSSTDGGQTFTAPDYNAQTGMPFGAGVLVAVPGALYNGSFGDNFRTLALRQVAADPTRPGVVYALAPNDGLELGGAGVVSAQGVVFAVSYDYGQTWSSNFTVGNEPSITATLNTNQDASYAPVLNDDNGGFFQGFAPSLNNQVLGGQAMPTMTVDAHGNIVVTWYDTRNDPADHNLEVWSTVSTDGGQHFSANFPVSNTSFDPSAGYFRAANGKTSAYLGDQIGVAAAGGTAYAVWTDTRAGSQNIYFGSYLLNPKPAVPTDRFSPNSTPQTATNLGTVTVQQEVPLLTLPPGNSDEWFSLQAGASGQLSVSVTASANGQNLQLTLTDTNGNILPAVVTSVLDASGAVIGQELEFPSVAGQTYLVHVSGQGSTAINYTLTAGALSGDFGTQVQGGTSDTLAAGGQNLYRLTAAVTGDILVTLGANADVQGAGLSLEIVSGDGQTVLASGPAAGAAAGASEQVSLPVTQGQVVLIQVSGLDANSAGDFTLEFSNLDQSEIQGIKTLFFPTQGNPTSIAAADLSGTGKLDLLVTNTDASDTLGVLQGNGDGSFQAEKQYGVGPGLSGGGLSAGQRQIAVADLSGSRIPDVIVPNFRAGGVSVLMGNGDGSFQPQRTFDAVASPDSMVTGDFNGDGSTDVIVLQNFSQGHGGSQFAVLLGRGDGTFLPPVLYQTVFTRGAGAMVVGDLNGDGKPDLIIFSPNAAEGQIFYGNGDGTFRNGGTFATGETVARAALADLTGDGKLDLITTGVNTGNVYVMLGNGDGTFQTPVAYTAMAPRPGDFVAVDGLAVTNFGNSSPNAPLNIVVTAASRTGASPAEVIMLPGLGSGQFGAPVVLANVGTSGNIATGDFTGDGTTDLAVADNGGVTVIYGTPLNFAANTTPQTARNLGNAPHLETLPQAIVTGHQDAYFAYTVPTEGAPGSGNEVISFAALFQYVTGAGLQILVTDPSGNVLGASPAGSVSNANFLVQAAQGEVLTIHVLGLAGSAGLCTLDIDVLPQVVSVQSQSVLPGGPATSIVLTLQGDQLDQATAENPANYTVTWLNPNGQNQVIPITGTGQPVVYDASANIDVATGLTYPTTVQQTITLLFAAPLPAGSYEISVSTNVQSAALNPSEGALLGGASHALVSTLGGSIIAGNNITVTNLVAASGKPNPGAIAAGTHFLTQMHSDLGAQLNDLLAQIGDDPSITAEINAQILARCFPGWIGSGTGTFAVVWLDPVSIDLADPSGNRANFDLQTNTVVQNIPRTYVEVGGNVEVIVMAGNSGTFKLDVADVSGSSRGGAVVFEAGQSQTFAFTDAMRGGDSSFTLDLGTAEAVTAAVSEADLGTSVTGLTAFAGVGANATNTTTTSTTSTTVTSANVQGNVSTQSTTAAAPAGAGTDDAQGPAVADILEQVRGLADQLSAQLAATGQSFAGSLQAGVARLTPGLDRLGMQNMPLPNLNLHGVADDVVQAFTGAGNSLRTNLVNGVRRAMSQVEASAVVPAAGTPAQPAPAPGGQRQQQEQEEQQEEQAFLFEAGIPRTEEQTLPPLVVAALFAAGSFYFAGQNLVEKDPDELKTRTKTRKNGAGV